MGVFEGNTVIIDMLDFLDVDDPVVVVQKPGAIGESEIEVVDPVVEEDVESEVEIELNVKVADSEVTEESVVPSVASVEDSSESQEVFDVLSSADVLSASSDFDQETDELEAVENEVRQDPVLIESSSDISFIPLVGSALGFVLVLVLVLFFVTHRKGHRTVRVPEPISPRVQSLINWIHTYQGQYTEDVLRQTLLTQGYHQDEVDAAFRRK